MIKLIACDLDGTLLNSSMEVSEGNVQAIKRAQQNGIEFMVASGRAPHESQPMMKEYGIDCGFINLNGGLVFDTAGKLIVKNPLDLETAKKICRLLKKEGFYFELVTGSHVYSEDLSQRITNVAHLMVELNPMLTFKEAVLVSASKPAIVSIQQVPSYEDLMDEPGTEVMKILVFDSRGPCAFTEVIKEIQKLGDLSITSSAADNIEINAASAQKGQALMDYAAAKGIKREEVAAIGDNMNDESMIVAAGTGVAMGNAVPQIKKVASFVTKNNNEDGVAWAIDRIISDNQKESDK
ncbi:haloacid dehalogenase [Lactobacillus nasalidis]|uniref:Haloacid dehalogenase n=1 Tax=Lactobacillus nasalidis TaxID=2797258 RepID=A0ABQ3W5L7_9LACO|nr:Cof-type HAD-IIB family hydrolase [Lactobacillus nasalidis]GHV98315.1 haloacid dehalogenase [Lactobacillus nasalidis]GHV98677.1 haloacid dehalogenase [Lactobacillus nasalidis]GHW00384.1 haloacid dehalogenase [Lactobacillus nasalidis]